jgi:hypothetical protein
MCSDCPEAIERGLDERRRHRPQIDGYGGALREMPVGEMAAADPVVVNAPFGRPRSMMRPRRTGSRSGPVTDDQTRTHADDSLASRIIQ